jgi:hypothetical protein
MRDVINSISATITDHSVLLSLLSQTNEDQGRIAVDFRWIGLCVMDDSLVMHPGSYFIKEM